jgi:hypothetical protein
MNIQPMKTGPEEAYLYNGVVYTAYEEQEASAIRAMEDGDEKNTLIADFTSKISKTFPYERGISFTN